MLQKIVTAVTQVVIALTHLHALIVYAIVMSEIGNLFFEGRKIDIFPGNSHKLSKFVCFGREFRVINLQF